LLWVFPACRIPRGPDPVDVAMVHPEYGVAGRCRHISHVGRVAGKNVNRAMQIAIQLTAEDAVIGLSQIGQDKKIGRSSEVFVQRLAGVHVA
jgi:hypothetical protein